MTTPTYTGQLENEHERPFKEKAKEQARNALSKTQERAGETMQKAGEQVKGRISESKDAAAHSLGHLATAIREAGSSLQENEDQKLGGVVTDAAGTVENISSYLERTSVDEFVTETERFARRSPSLFLGSALAIGFVLGRFLTSSNEDKKSFDSQGMQRALPQDASSTAYSGLDKGASGYSAGSETGGYTSSLENTEGDSNEPEPFK